MFDYRGGEKSLSSIFDPHSKLSLATRGVKVIDKNQCLLSWKSSFAIWIFSTALNIENNLLENLKCYGGWEDCPLGSFQEILPEFITKKRWEKPCFLWRQRAKSITGTNASSSSKILRPRIFKRNIRTSVCRMSSANCKITKWLLRAHIVWDEQLRLSAVISLSGKERHFAHL